MKQRRARDYNSLDDARSTLRMILIEAGPDGLSSGEMATKLKTRKPVVIPLLTEQMLRDWCRREAGRMKDRDGLPLYRSVARRYVPRAFWDETAYREVGMASIEVRARRHEKALRLAGAAERIREATGAVLDPTSRDLLEDWLKETMVPLGPSGECSWLAGKELADDEAISLALDDG